MWSLCELDGVSSPFPVLFQLRYKAQVSCERCKVFSAFAIEAALGEPPTIRSDCEGIRLVGWVCGDGVGSKGLQKSVALGGGVYIPRNRHHPDTENISLTQGSFHNLPSHFHR